MSSEQMQNEKKNHQIERKNDFAGRLIELCGTKQPKEIAECLDISYQTARNYLKGRLPEADVLMKVAERTGCSIHWLLTGEGEKFIEKDRNSDTLQLTDQIKIFVRQVCVELINELFPPNNSDGRVYPLIPMQLRAEKKDVNPLTPVKSKPEEE